MAILGLYTKTAIDDRHPATKMYYFKVWEDGVLMQEFLPVLDHSGVACLYETISGELYYPLGGEVIAGDVIHRGFVIRNYTTEDGLTINSNGEVIGVSGVYASGDVIIPDSITTPYFTMDIIGILDDVYKNNTDITSITLPKNMRSVSSTAFSGCNALDSITITARMKKSIAERIFEDYQQLSKLTYVPEYAATLEYITPSGTQYINTGFFPTNNSKFEMSFGNLGINIK